MSLINSISECNVFFNLMYNLNFKIMKIQKYFEASTESTPMNEIEEAINSYDLNRQLEKIIENDPTKVIKITYNATIEY